MSIQTKVFDGVPRWLRVVPHIDGRLPAYAENKSCWIRLDLIDRVEAAVCIGVGPEDTYEHGIRVYVRETSYYASPDLFVGKEAEKMVDSVLGAVGAAVSR